MAAVEDLKTSSPPALWRNPDFLLLWSGQAVSSVGTRVSSLAYPLLALAITGSPVLAGLVGALASVPYFILMLPAGALVDRWDRKRVMILCDLGRAAAMGSIPLALAAGPLTPIHLALVALADGTLSAFFDLAAASALPRVVEARGLPQALSATSIADQLSRMVGPALGGLLYGLSRALPFLADAASYAVSVVSLLFIRARFQGERAPAAEKVWAEVRVGMRWLWRQPLLRFLALLVGGLNLFSMGFPLIMIVRAQQLGADAFTIGLLFATGGVGGIVGAAVTPWLHRRYRFGDLVVGVTWVWVITWVPYALAPSLLLLSLANVLGWLIVPMLYVTVSAYRLAVVPDELRGRVSSAYNLVTAGAQPLSLAATGWLLGAVGPSATILLITAPQAILAALATAHARLRATPRLEEAVGPECGRASVPTDM